MIMGVLMMQKRNDKQIEMHVQCGLFLWHFSTSGLVSYLLGFWIFLPFVRCGQLSSTFPALGPPAFPGGTDILILSNWESLIIS
jgi:hypothetical protein